MQKIIPHLWFATNAEEAVAFYTSIFNNGKILNTTLYPEAGHEIHGMPAGSIMNIQFEIEGYTMMALNGGPAFTFTPAISFMVDCPTNEEVDALWNALADGGEALMPLDTYPFSERYGWIKDKYGVTWQLVYAADVDKRKIVPSFMFAGAQYGKAEKAIQTYTSIFEDSSIGNVLKYGSDQGEEKEGTVMFGDFTIAGQTFTGMDSAGVHDFTFNEAISLMIMCKDQAEIDYYWEKLSAVPESEMCGWVKDTYGVSWQITPLGMEEMLNNPDKEKAERAMSAMLKMKKIDINALKKAVA